MFFQTEQQIENIGKRFLSCKNAFKVFCIIFFMHAIYILGQIYILDKPFVLSDFLYSITMDFAAPGTLQVESLIKFLFINDFVMNNIYIRVLLLISLPIFLNFAFNPMLRKAAREYVNKIYFTTFQNDRDQKKSQQ